MTGNILIFVLLCACAQTSCNVLNYTKLEIPAPENTGVDSGVVEVKKDKYAVKNVSVTEQNVYLEDVFYKLKSLNWSQDQEVCLKQTLWLLSSLKNFSLWAVWEWDSISSEPIGLLYGNHYQLGNFDECMNPPWEDAHPDLSTQYCLAKIQLQKNGHTRKHKINAPPYDPYSSALDYLQYRPEYSRPINELTWGVCVPSTCSQSSVERLMAILLTRSHLGTTGMTSRVNVTEPCQRSLNEQKVYYDAPFIGFWLMIGFFIAVSLICTHINAKNGNDPNTIGSEIVQAFSIKENAKNLMKIKRNGSEVLYGIRFFTMCLIVFDHQIGIFNAGPISDGLNFDKKIYSTIAVFLLHDDVLVDSYFFLSGFLVMHALMNFKRPPNPIGLLIKRYVRIAVAFAVVVFFMSAVFPYTGSGPLWPSAVAAESDTCRKNWWLSILMLGNYIDSENICLVVSWYIPCDFHFFVLTVILYVIYQKWPLISKVLGVIVTIGALVAPGIISYVNKLPAIQLFTYDFLVNPRASDQFHLTYIKSHTRMMAYVIGLASGYLFTKNLLKNNLHCISKTWSTIGALFGIALMLSVMTFGAQFLKISYTQLEGSIYAAVDRPLWTTGLAVFVLSCCLGEVPFIKSFLSWYPWAPLSRLTYGLYLVHSVIITRNIFVARNPRHNDVSILMSNAMGTVVWGSIAALFLWMLFEAPINNLVVIFMKPRGRSTRNAQDIKTPEPSPESPVASSSQTPTSSGHLQENLPTVIQYSSKV